jgi:diaminopimelate decarboxylase
MRNNLSPDLWGLKIGPAGELMLGCTRIIDLAEQYATPLHIINQERLLKKARSFITAVRNSYPGDCSVHYAFKCNSVPHVVQTLQKAGLKAEVCNEFELQLVKALRFNPIEIIVNGPCKTEQFLQHCISDHVGLIVIDSIDELFCR